MLLDVTKQSSLPDLLLRYLEWNWTARFTILIACMSALALYDYRKHNKSFWKAREYGYILISASIFGLLGMLNDQITARISPEYFNLGKGIPLGDGFLFNASLLGGEAGFMIGFAVYGVFLIISKLNRLDSPSAFNKLLFKLKTPLIYSALLVPCFCLLFYLCRNWQVFDRLLSGLSPLQKQHFLIVWGWHIALYTGCIVGTVVASVGLTKKKVSSPA